MELLTTAIITFLFTTASAKPSGWRQHHDITDSDRSEGWLDRNNLGSWLFTESSSDKDSSSESDQSLESREFSDSSESQSSEESSEEVLITDETTAVMTTTAMTNITLGDGSTLTPEPDTMSTGEPTVTVTPPPATPTTPNVTFPSNVTHCVTVEIPTEAPRGDN